MNGPHDMGGGHGWGPVRPEPDEPPFHAAWERRRVRAHAGDGRHRAVEHRSVALRPREPAARGVRPAVVLPALAGGARAPAGGARSGQRRGARRRGQALESAEAGANVLRAEDVAATLARGGPAARPSSRPARFAVGDRVRARNLHPAGHTRLPRYLRGHAGVVERVHGCHVFPDSRAARPAASDPQWLYSVCFEARELWGETARRSDGQASTPTPSSPTWRPPDAPARPPPARGPPLLSAARRCRAALGCPASRATRRAPSSASRGRRRLSPSRWPCTSAASSPGPSGPPRSPPRSSAPRPPAIPTPATTYYHHWLAALEALVAGQEPRRPRHPPPLPRTPGTTPPTAPPTATPSSSAPRTSGTGIEVRQVSWAPPLTRGADTPTSPRSRGEVTDLLPPASTAGPPQIVRPLPSAGEGGGEVPPAHRQGIAAER